MRGFGVVWSGAVVANGWSRCFLLKGVFRLWFEGEEGKQSANRQCADRERQHIDTLTHE